MKPATHLAFAAVLKEERARKGLTQEALAFNAGISRAYLSMLETGVYSPTLDCLLSLASGLGLSLSQLGALIDSKLQERPGNDE